MSDVGRIAQSRGPERINPADFEARSMKAAEHSADALEGIRQDLTAMNLLLVQIAQALNGIRQRP